MDALTCAGGIATCRVRAQIGLMGTPGERVRNPQPYGLVTSETISRTPCILKSET